MEYSLGLVEVSALGNAIIMLDDMLKAADIVIICTAHACFDYDRIQKCSKEIFDTRNAMKDVKDRSNIELL